MLNAAIYKQFALNRYCIKQILHLEICEHYSVDIKILSLLWSSVKSRLYMLWNTICILETVTWKSRGPSINLMPLRFSFLSLPPLIPRPDTTSLICSLWPYQNKSSAASPPLIPSSTTLDTPSQALLILPIHQSCLVVSGHCIQNSDSKYFASSRLSLSTLFLTFVCSEKVHWVAGMPL